MKFNIFTLIFILIFSNAVLAGDGTGTGPVNDNSIILFDDGNIITEKDFIVDANIDSAVLIIPASNEIADYSEEALKTKALEVSYDIMWQSESKKSYEKAEAFYNKIESEDFNSVKLIKAEAKDFIFLQ